jgi:hypothetical protein
MIPMIRKILPNTIAADIMGVQPMAGPVGSIFSMRFNRPMIVDRTVRLLITKVDLHWNVGVNVNDHSRIDEILAWLKNIPQDQYWTAQKDPWSTFYINFYDEETVLAFKLAWDNAR